MAGHLPLYQLEGGKEAVSKAGFPNQTGGPSMGAGAVAEADGRRGNGQQEGTPKGCPPVLYLSAGAFAVIMRATNRYLGETDICLCSKIGLCAKLKR